MDIVNAIFFDLYTMQVAIAFLTRSLPISYYDKVAEKEKRDI
jgi:hypothetical protein